MAAVAPTVAGRTMAAAAVVVAKARRATTMTVTARALATLVVGSRRLARPAKSAAIRAIGPEIAVARKRRSRPMWLRLKRRRNGP